jgi:hypothetical protein
MPASSAQFPAVEAARIGATLALGAAGGTLCWALDLPLPWMLGAMLATLAAVLMGAGLQAPTRARSVVTAVIGVMLGAAFTPDLLGDIAGWALSLAILLGYLAVAAALLVPFYIRVGRMDPITAFFSAMPGGMVEMMMLGEDMGGDGRRIVLAHAARIVITVAVIALVFRWGLGLDVSGAALGEGKPLGAPDVVLLAVSGAVGVWLGPLLRLPAPTLLGPMLLSAAVHLAGWTEGAPPGWLIAAAQVFLGTIMGCRFLGAGRALVLRALALSFGATSVALVLCLAVALTFAGMIGQPVSQMVLAFAPGGLTEMGLVALSLGADVAYVSAHHIVRIAVLVAVAPLVLKPLAARLQR